MTRRPVIDTLPPDTAAPLRVLLHNLRCQVSQQRCETVVRSWEVPLGADAQPTYTGFAGVCGVDDGSRSSLGLDWHCPTCALYHFLLAPSKRKC